LVEHLRLLFFLICRCSRVELFDDRHNFLTCLHAGIHHNSFATENDITRSNHSIGEISLSA